MAGSDIAMNQFQIVTEYKYVYVEKADGGQGKVLSTPAYLEGKDLNDYMYKTEAAFEINCINTPFPYGFLIVSNFKIGAESLVLQVAYGREADYRKISYRVYRTSYGWKDWVSII